MSGRYKTEAQIEFADLMGELDISPAELSRQVELSKSAISLILKGERSPRPTTLVALRNLLKRRQNNSHHEVRPLREEGDVYIASMDLSLLKNEMVRDIFLQGVDELKTVDSDRRSKLLRHLALVNEEMEKRNI